MIKQCQEIVQDKGGIIQLYEDDEDNPCIALIDDGRIVTAQLTYFDKDELTLILRHIQKAIK